jgi:ferrous iron transport protein B
MHIKVALVGNPNCGKTTLFNAYTGAKHKVGNWPGVTVEKKEGLIKHDGKNITLVDLPGIYSISPYSLEEILTREYILNFNPDAIINIVDASNLERNLYLTLQLIELGRPVIIALNMIDVLEERGVSVDIEALSKALNVPVIPVVAVSRKGLTKLLHQVIRSSKHKEDYKPIRIDYGETIENKIQEVASKIHLRTPVNAFLLRWLSIKVLENDHEILSKLRDESIEELPIDHQRHFIENHIPGQEETYEEEIGKRKYEYIESFIEDVLMAKENKPREILSDKIDALVTHPILGIPIFLVMMLLVFTFTFTVGNYFADLFESGIGWFGGWLTRLMIEWNVADWLISLIVDGVISGVGGILIFLPNIAALFIAMSLLEDTGYMARVALIMDKNMSRIGLNGKAVIPLILGFGCTVPAIMTTRSLNNEKDRLITILITPFMSCSARFPIYVLFSRAFFPGREILIAFSLYFLGIVVSIIMALVFRKFMGKSENSGLILELPSYKRPSLKTTGIFVWEKVREYLERAGTIIFVASVVLWFVLEFNFSGKVAMTESLGADLGRLIAPIFTPLGFGDWQAALALIAGVLGKEIVVSSMSVIYGVGEVGLYSALNTIGFTAASAYAFMVFSLLYTPCVATLGVIKSETRSWKWMWFSFGYQLLVAYAVSLFFFQILK